MADRVGPGVMDREKRGFGLPLQDWLNGSLRDMLHDVLFSTAARSRGLFRPPALQTLIRENEQGHPTRAFLLWNLLILELWFANQDDQRVDHISLR
jgi:asparagine synthase (glutamine-hydrolysing)